VRASKKTGRKKPVGKKPSRKKQAGKKPSGKKASGAKPRADQETKPQSAAAPSQPANGSAQPQLPDGSQAMLGGGWHAPQNTSLAQDIGSTPINASTLATLCGVANSTVTTWSNEGLPSRAGGKGQGKRAEYLLSEVMPWLAQRGSKRSSIDSRDAVSREQAIKLMRENALAEQELINTAEMGRVLEKLLILNHANIKSLPGRLCNVVAAESSAAVCRDHLRKACRSATAAFAQELAQYAERIGLAAEDIRNAEAAAGEDA